MTNPVALWTHGHTERQVDAATSGEHGLLILDLGEDWTTYLFSEGVDAEGKPSSSAYRATYLALARGEYPEDLHGARAKEDKYLELYGILPTLQLVRARMHATAGLKCTKALDYEPLQSFTGLATYTNPQDARKQDTTYLAAQARALSLMMQQHVSTLEELDTTNLPKRDQDGVATYKQMTPARLAIQAMQLRMSCEGYFAGKGKYIAGVMDWPTHEALAEFERRHRVFSWGFIGKDSLVPLRETPLEADRESVLRVLTERAIHAAGVIEDGSTSTLDNGLARTFTGADGQAHAIPNLAAALRDALIEAFGLQTPESTLAWLDSLGDMPPDAPRYIALEMVPLPEYYGPEMELTLDYDRGDVWYDFPYDDKGKEVPQPVSRRPLVTVSTLYNGVKLPLAQFGTTIGGWRAELIKGVTMWKYKGSPVGPRAWQEIVAAPVWMPPDGTPPEALLTRNRERKLPSDPEYLVNYHETGPSYASAYGLVAAYHRTYARTANGRIYLGTDEGIRTHGSVDYMSIMRRHSHGCHRLHNHIALRLMSFVLAHRPHDRLGPDPMAFRRSLVYKDQTYLLDLKTGGYVFKLKTPLLVNVEEGRLRGQVKEPIEIAIPKFDEQVGAYVMPDGSKVLVRGGRLVPAPKRPPPPVPASPTRGKSRVPVALNAPVSRAGSARQPVLARAGSTRVVGALSSLGLNAQMHGAPPVPSARRGLVAHATANRPPVATR
jgi:hypothetical protein